MQYRKIDDCEQLLRGDLRLIQAQLIDYTIHLREELKLSASTINSRLSAIKKFYDNNDIELKWKRSEQQCSRRTTRALTENGFCLSRLL
jgi:transcriptional antiterminator